MLWPSGRPHLSRPSPHSASAAPFPRVRDCTPPCDSTAFAVQVGASALVRRCNSRSALIISFHMYLTNNQPFSARGGGVTGRSLRHIGTAALLSGLLGAITSYWPPVALAVTLFGALLWLALAQPRIACVVIVVWMALPFTWTPSVGGIFLDPAEVGGIIFLTTGLVRHWRFRPTIVDGILAAYISISIIAAITNQEAFTLVQFNLQSVAVPYVGWRLLFSSDTGSREIVIPCLLAVGTAVAILGLIEFVHGSGLFIHVFVNPRLATWAHTYFRLGHLRIAGPFAQPIAMGMFLLIPIGFAIVGTSRLRLAALLVLLPAEILTLSRGPWVGMIVLSLLLLPLIFRKTQRAHLVGGFIVLAACAVAFGHPIEAVLASTTQQGSGDNANAAYRVNLLQTSVSEARLLGNPYDAESISSLYGQAGFKDVASWYAETLGQTGWLGLLCLLAFAGAAILALWRGYRHRLLTLTMLAAVSLAQMIALTTAPPIANYNAFFWLTIACLSSWFVNSRGATARAMKRIDPFAEEEHPDLVIVSGDVDSTMAANARRRKLRHPGRPPIHAG
jgi:hypothetical protein